MTTARHATRSFSDHLIDGCDPTSSVRDKALIAITLVGSWLCLVTAGVLLLR